MEQAWELEWKDKKVVYGKHRHLPGGTRVAQMLRKRGGRMTRRRSSRMLLGTAIDPPLVCIMSFWKWSNLDMYNNTRHPMNPPQAQMLVNQKPMHLIFPIHKILKRQRTSMCTMCSCVGVCVCMLSVCLHACECVCVWLRLSGRFCVGGRAGRGRASGWVGGRACLCSL